MNYTVVLPISGVTIDPWVVLLIGIGGGLVSSLFRIGGGVFITPMLLMIGIPPIVALPSQLHNSIGTNLMGFLVNWRRHEVDVAFALYVFLGGFIGAILENIFLGTIVNSPKFTMQLNFIYLVVLGIIGTLLLAHNIHIMVTPKSIYKNITMPSWMMYLPWHRIFIRSRIEMSLLVPISIGFLTGLLTNLLGGGVSLLIVPFVAYLIHRSSEVINGTSRLSSFLISITVLSLQAYHYAVSDWVLVLLLIIGSTAGSKLLSPIVFRIVPKHYFGLLGAFFILTMCGRFAYLFATTTAENNLPISSAIKLKSQSCFIWLNTMADQTNSALQWMPCLAIDSPLIYNLIGIVSVIILGLFFDLSFTKIRRIVYKIKYLSS